MEKHFVVLVAISVVLYVVVGTFISFWLQEFVEKWDKEYPKRSKIVWYTVNNLAFFATFLFFPALFVGGVAIIAYSFMADLIGPSTRSANKKKEDAEQ